MRIRALESSDPAWDAFVHDCPGGTLFHLYGWREAVRRAYGHTGTYLTAEADGEIVGVLPLIHLTSRLFGRALVSLPFVDYGGICARDAEAAARLLDAAVDRARASGVGHVELRQASSNGLELPEGHEKVAMLLDLPPAPEELWRRLPLKRRSRIQKAQAALQASVHGAEASQEFYRVFARNMRDLGSPVHGRAFFDEISAAFPEHTRIILVSRAGRTVGAGFCLGYKDCFMVPWSSSLPEDFKLHPNFLLFWAALEYACRHGYRTFDFGRSSVGSGTYEFKRGWRAQPRPLRWQYVLLNGGDIPEPAVQQARFRLLVEAWKRLPVPLANRIGPRIRKHISL